MRTEKWRVEPQRQGDRRIVESSRKPDSASVKAIRIFGMVESIEPIDGLFKVTVSGSPTIICPRTWTNEPSDYLTRDVPSIARASLP